MKIAITSDIYVPMTNGVAVFAQNLARGLVKQGHQVLVVCPSFKGEHYEEEVEGIKIVHCKSVRFHFYPDQINQVPDKKELLGLPVPRLVYKNGIWWAPSPYDEVEQALLRFGPDVIHLQTAETIALATVKYAKRYGTPLVSTGHAYPDNITGQFRLGFFKKPVDAALRTYMASFLKHSEYATMPTEMAIGDLVPKDRKRFKVTVEALSNGVDLTCFKPGRPKKTILAKYDLAPDRPYVLYVGRVDPEKSIGKVVQAFAQIAHKVSEAELVIVGDGTDLANLREMVTELALETRVKFLGKVLPPDLIDIYRAGTVFATASETETQGIVLIEAVAVGLPLIAVDAGAVKELCQNRKNGILCQPGDIAGLARAMIRILTKPDLQVKYSAKSLEVAQRHDLNRTLARFMEIYQEAIRLKMQHEIK